MLATPAGSGSTGGIGDVEQSLVEAPAQASGVLVLPMGEDAERFLYVVLPAAQATPDWLALGVLVADAWAAAEEGWAAQAAAVVAARLDQDLGRAARCSGACCRRASTSTPGSTSPPTTAPATASAATTSTR